VLYVVLHPETGRETTYPDSAAYEAAWNWFEATGQEGVVAWYTQWDRDNNEAPRHEIWAGEDRADLAADWADIATAAYAWTLPV
jgi:hypothetical protein